MEQLVKAIIGVMNDVKSIEKNMQVGSGSYGYKGVADKDVKQKIGEAMQKHGLAIIPTSVEPNVQIERWEEGGKQKQSTFTEVRTKYLLIHESGQSLELSGYGHGIDSGDKGAGKATTYALKYALLYLFMVPTGNIDDADNSHSEELPKSKVVPVYVAPKPVKAVTLPDLPEDKWVNVVDMIQNNKELGLTEIVKRISTKYSINPETKTRIENEFKSKRS
jgi:hypothetical protein